MFQGNTKIKYFDEFQYFTKASQGGRCFENCSSLKRVTINSTGWRFEYMAISGTNARWDIINARTDVLSYSNWGTRGIGGGSIMILRMNWVAALAANPQGKPTTYVPDELLDDYRGASNWSSLKSMIHGFFDMPPIIIKDGTYTMTLRSIFEDYSDLQISIEENDYLTLSVEDDVMIITASGITSSTDTTVAISYSFAYRGSTISGTINLPVLYKEIIEFEDAEAKRICVANWGGEYRASTNKYGMKGEITMEQAAAVTTIGNYDTSSTTVFTNNKLITKFTELRYFINLQTCGRAFVQGCSNLTEIVIPPSVIRFGNGAFQNTQKLTKFYCYPKAAPAYNDNGAIFAATMASSMGYNTRNTGNNEFHVPIDATGYELGQYGSSGSRLLSTSYCGFHIVYDL